MESVNKKKIAPLVLIVDDDRTIRMTIEALVKKQGYRSITAINGETACATIKKMHDKIDVILLDRIMPGMDGMKVAQWLKQQPNLMKPPIVMITVADTIKQITEGIDAGVFYYLTKPIRENILKSVISSAIRESWQRRTLREELTHHKNSFMLMQNGMFQLKNLEEAENLSYFIANYFPNAEQILPAIAELLINSIEHGNLKISYDKKTELIKSGKWLDEVHRLTKLPQHKDKVVEIVFSRTKDAQSIQVTDQGDGFSWERFLNVDPARATDNHGRGIARANMLFSKLQYNKKGNQVIATMNNLIEQKIDW